MIKRGAKASLKTSKRDDHRRSLYGFPKNLISLEKPLCKRLAATLRRYVGKQKVTRKRLCKPNEFLIVEAPRIGLPPVERQGHFVPRGWKDTCAVGPSRCFLLTLFCGPLPPLIVLIFDRRRYLAYLFAMNSPLTTLLLMHTRLYGHSHANAYGVAYYAYRWQADSNRHATNSTSFSLSGLTLVWLATLREYGMAEDTNGN